MTDSGCWTWISRKRLCGPIERSGTWFQFISTAIAWIWSGCANLGTVSIRIVEDCAQSIGASHAGINGGIPSGLAGDCAATSFYPTKNLGAFGDGGALLTGSAEIAATARVLRDYGQGAKYRHDSIGYNSRLDEVHAAILRRVLLPRLQAATDKRRIVAERYLKEISNPLVTPLGRPDGSDSCWHLFPVRAPLLRKQELAAHLRAGGSSGGALSGSMMDQPAMREVKFEQTGSCDTARQLCACELSLPIHPFLTPGEISRVVDACNTWS